MSDGQGLNSTSGDKHYRMERTLSNVAPKQWIVGCDGDISECKLYVCLTCRDSFLHESNTNFYLCVECSECFFSSHDLESHKCKSSVKVFICPTCFQAFNSEGSLQRHMLEHNDTQYYCSGCYKYFTRIIDAQKHNCDGVSNSTEENYPNDKVYMDLEPVSSEASTEESNDLNLVEDDKEQTDNAELLEVSSTEADHQEFVNDTENIDPQEAGDDCDETNEDQTEIEIEIEFDAGDDEEEMQEHMTNPSSPANKEVDKLISNDTNLYAANQDQQPADTVGCSIAEKIQTRKRYRDPSLVKAKTYPCEECKKVFFSEEELNVHEDIHERARPYGCHLCQEKFTASCSLKRHLRQLHSVGGTPQKRNICPSLCTVCGKNCINPSDLKRHSYSHTGEKPFSCLFCAQRFICVGTARRHMREFHDPDAPERKVKKSFKCKLCPKLYRSRGELADHEASHQGMQMYNCKVCAKTFTWRATLTRHLKSKHEGTPYKRTEKKLKCPHCEKLFRYESDLEKHIFTHEGVRPYLCPYCAKSCTQESNLKRHVRLVHKK